MILTTDKDNLIILLPLGKTNDYMIETKFSLEDVRKLLNDDGIAKLEKIGTGEGEIEKALDIAQWDFDHERNYHPLRAGANRHYWRINQLRSDYNGLYDMV